MAKIKSIFEGGQGKLGALVFYQVGEDVFVRTRAQQFRDRKSPAQLAQRQRLQVMNKFLSPFRGFLSRTFSAGDTGKTGLQAAKSYNMRNALIGDYPNIRVDKQKVLLSRGPLPVPASATASLQPDGILIEWKNGEEAKGAAAYDFLVVMAFSANQEKCYWRTVDVHRYESRYLWKPPFNEAEDVFPDIWIAFRNNLDTLMSNSVYAGNG